jgi:hypothetical protein
MTIVDLRGRTQEPEIAALLASGISSPELERLHTGEWPLVGWSRSGTVVAAMALERLDETTIAVRALLVDPAEDDRDATGRALLDAFADIATASELVTELDRDQLDLFAGCGFEITGTSEVGRTTCARQLGVEEADPASVRALTLSELEHAMRASWDSATSDDPLWSEANPALGQCDVTASLLRELLGGDIVIANVLRDGRRVGGHAWNRLPSGLTVDLTRDQFRDDETFGRPRVQEPIAMRRSPERYQLLRERVLKRISSRGEECARQDSNLRPSA